jgi:2,3-bisphosphoglycerate-dependent phosphoglycerate mutase
VTTLILARHGETDWNRDGRFQGHSDPPLNERGREQARGLADLLDDEPLEAVYSSDLRRAHETAQIVAERKGLPVIVEPQLRERDVGHWAGLTLSEIEERFPEQIRRWREGTISAGESRESLSRRVVEAARRIALAHPDGHVLVVTHGGAARMLRHAAGQDEHLSAPGLANCEVLRIVVRDDAVRGLD